MVYFRIVSREYKGKKGKKLKNNDMILKVFIANNEPKIPSNENVEDNENSSIKYSVLKSLKF